MTEGITPNDGENRLCRISDCPKQTEEDRDFLGCHPFHLMCQVHENRILDVHRKTGNEGKDVRNEWRDVAERNRNDETTNHDESASQENRFSRCSAAADFQTNKSSDDSGTGDKQIDE